MGKKSERQEKRVLAAIERRRREALQALYDLDETDARWEHKERQAGRTVERKDYPSAVALRDRQSRRNQLIAYIAMTGGFT